MRVSVDFHTVEPAHAAIHERLENWARWCYGNGGRSVAPMFRLYRSTDQWVAPPSMGIVDSLDAQRVQKGVSGLPEGHRKAVSWCYVIRCSPKRIARDLAVSMDGLALLIRDGRSMLVNRGV